MKKLLRIAGDRDIVTVTYDLDNSIEDIAFQEETNSEQKAWILQQLSSSEKYKTCGLTSCAEYINKKTKAKNKALVIAVEADLSFERFWEEYDYKIGKKTRVRKKWEVMDDMERIKALKHIKTYRYFLIQHSHIQKQYPETFLNRAEWNN